MKYISRLLVMGFAWFVCGWSEQTLGPKTVAAAQCADERQAEKTAQILRELLTVENEQELRKNLASIESLIISRGCSFVSKSTGGGVWSSPTLKLQGLLAMDGVMVFRIGSAFLKPESSEDPADARYVVALEINHEQLHKLLERKSQKKEMRDA